MTFWNGTEWVPEVSVTPPPGRPRRARDWIATLVMVAALGLYVLPFATTSAAGPTLTLTPSSGPPGTRVNVIGQGFASRTQLQLTWDSAIGVMPKVSLKNRGNFRASFTVPPNSSVGSHSLGLQQTIRAGSLAPAAPTAECRVRRDSG